MFSARWGDSPKEKEREQTWLVSPRSSLCWDISLETILEFILTNDWSNGKGLQNFWAGNGAIRPTCAMLRCGEKMKRNHENTVFKLHWKHFIYELKCVAYRNTVGAPYVTQTDTAMKENVFVLLLWQEQQGSEICPLGRASLSHWHLLTVSGTPGREDGDGQQGQYSSL